MVVCSAGFSTGWLMSSKEICPRFYICSLISCEHEKSGVGPTPCPIRFPIQLTSPRGAPEIGMGPCSFPPPTAFSQAFPSVCSSPSLPRSMRSPSTLLTHCIRSLRHSSCRFHYPRTLVGVDLPLPLDHVLGLNLGSHLSLPLCVPSWLGPRRRFPVTRRLALL